jgi:hypothetical protein
VNGQDPTQKHHDGLSNSQVRDLLAAEERDVDVSIGLYTTNDEFRDLLVRNVEEARKKLLAYDRGQALKSIMEKFGWSIHDVSECVEYNSKTYRSFIGSEKECEKVYGNKEKRR